jgi:hypothetical protein
MRLRTGGARHRRPAGRRLPNRAARRQIPEHRESSRDVGRVVVHVRRQAYALIAGPHQHARFPERPLDLEAAVRGEYDVAGPVLGGLGREDGETELHQPGAQ